MIIICYRRSAAGYPFMPSSGPGMASDLSPAYSGSHVNNISPNALSSYPRAPMVSIKNTCRIFVWLDNSTESLIICYYLVVRMTY